MTRFLVVVLVAGCGHVMPSSSATDAPETTEPDAAETTGCSVTCSDGSCARLAWSFDDGDLGGIAIVSPTSQSLVVRDHDSGDLGLAIDTSQLVETTFTAPVCSSGLLDTRALTLTANVMFGGGTDTGVQYYVQASTPDPEPNAYLGTLGVASDTWTTLSMPLGASSFSGGTTTVTFKFGTYGAAFAGTVWFDDITLQ